MKDSINNNSNKTVMEIFRLYANADLPKGVSGQFKSWLTSNFHQDEKDAALLNIWHTMEPSFNRRAEKNAWKQVNKRLGIKQTKKFTLLHKRSLRVAAVIIPVFVISGTFYFNYLLKEQQLEMIVQLECVVFSTEEINRQVILSDGTEVWMNRQSNITYSDDRRAQLTGEAHFTVAHDKDKQFVVETDFLKAVVHGTSFNIHAYPEIDETIVSLYNGKLEVQLPDTTLMLQPGDEWIINKKDNSRIKRKTLKSSPDWNRALISYNEITLNDIFRDLENKYPVKIKGDGSFLDETMTLKFEKNTGIREVMFLISEINGKFEFTIQDNVIAIFPGKTIN